MRYHGSMTDVVSLVIVALVGFSVLRALLPRRLRVSQQADGALEFQRPLGRRLLEVTRLGVWIALLLALFIASWRTDFTLGVLVGGGAAVVLVWRIVNRIRQSTVVIDRRENQVRYGERAVGRTIDVRAVALQPNYRDPLALLFREVGQPERRWSIPGADPVTAEAVGRQIADYLEVPLEGSR
jgi:hypothetical protein